MDDLRRKLNAEQDPAQRLELQGDLAATRVASGDFDGAIGLLRDALAEVPGDARTMHRLAEALLARAHNAPPDEASRDYRRAGELLYQLGQACLTPPTEERRAAFDFALASLAAVPNHDGALAIAERLAPGLGESSQLAHLWLAFIKSAGTGPETHKRRLFLARAYMEAGQLDDAIYCLEPAKEHAEAATLLTALLAQRQSSVGEPAPVTAESARAAGQAQADGSPGDAGDPPQARQQSPQERARDELHRQLHQLITERRQDEAASTCVEIIQLDAGDIEAFNFLESYYRRRRSYRELRDLLLTSSRVPGIAVDTRKLRLREVAGLSEGKLQDPNTAVIAYQGVVTLDPADGDAAERLKSLLRRTERWDEMVSLLEREAVAAADAEAKAALLEEIADIHRERPEHAQEHAEALNQLYELRPTPARRDALCDAYLSLQRYHDAVPLLREQLEDATDRTARRELQRRLSRLLEEELGDTDAAFAVCESLLADEPGDLGTLERMARMDEAAGNHERLLTTLARRVQVVDPQAQLSLLRRMGDIAAEALSDPSTAAVHYERALSLGGGTEVVQALAELYEQNGMHGELARLLEGAASRAESVDDKRRHLLRLAALQAESLDDRTAAKGSYETVISLGEDATALRFLLEEARRDGGAGEQAAWLGRLQAVTEDLEVRSSLLEELATLQELDLDDLPAAVETLTVLVRDVAPDDDGALERLSELSRGAGHELGLVTALERRLQRLAVQKVPPEPAAVARVAIELAERCEDPLRDPERAIRALSQWATLCPDDPEPERRLRPLLEARGPSEGLVATLDALGKLEPDEAEQRQAQLAAAAAAQALGNAHGAWSRLQPWVERGDVDALAQLTEVCDGAGWSDRLASLVVTLAQKPAEVTRQQRFWDAAAALYDGSLRRPEQALEAALRSLALDLSNADGLKRVERLAVSAKALPRLGQVYERLLAGAEDDTARVALLSRLADVLEKDAGASGLALDQVLRGCRMTPDDEVLFDRAVKLAGDVDRAADLLPVLDQRIAAAEAGEARLQLQVRAAELCDARLRDRVRAIRYLKEALRQTELAPNLADVVWDAAERLDQARPELGARDASHRLAMVHQALAREVDPGFAERLVLMAAEQLRARLNAAQEAYQVLVEGYASMPQNDSVYEALLTSAAQLGRLPALAETLAQHVDHAVDPMDTSALLEHLADLLDGPLDEPQQAAQTYTKLLQLRSDDGVALRLRATLKRSRSYQDLLVAISRQLHRTEDDEGRLILLREAAVTWEKGLKNRFEAADAWRRVLEAAPEDAEASAAVERLGRRSSTASLEELLGDDAMTAGEESPPNEAAEDEDPFPAVEPPRLVHLVGQCEAADAEAGAGAGAGEPSALSGDAGPKAGDAPVAPARPATGEAAGNSEPESKDPPPEAAGDDLHALEGVLGDPDTDGDPLDTEPSTA